MASLKIACITMGEQITAEQLIEKRIIMKTLKSKVVCEDIHIKDYDKRRHRMKTMEREDLDLS